MHPCHEKGRQPGRPSVGPQAGQVSAPSLSLSCQELTWAKGRMIAEVARRHPPSGWAFRNHPARYKSFMSVVARRPGTTPIDSCHAPLGAGFSWLSLGPREMALFSPP